MFRFESARAYEKSYSFKSKKRKIYILFSLVMLPSDSPPYLLETERLRLRNHGDRFIRNRADVVDRVRQELTEANANYVHLKNPGLNDLVYKEMYSCSKEAYKKLLSSALSVSHRPVTSEPLWPVKSRRKPCLHSPDIVLDLPNIRSNFCQNLMDWSSTDFLTVAFPNSVYLWHASTYTTLRFLAPNPTCVKWNPEGTRVLTAVRHGDIKIVNVESSREWVSSAGRSCHFSCFVTSAAYHPHQPLLLVGCSKGGVEMYNANDITKLIFTTTRYKSSVTQVAFSCDGNNFVVTTVGGFVGVYTMLSFYQPLAQAKLKGPTRAVSWHPWKGSYFATGDTLGSIYVYDVAHSSSALHVLGEFNPVFKNPIYSMSFNPLSAELVVSYRLRNDGVAPLSEDDNADLIVLASLDRVVDRMTGQWSSTNFISWSPDGTQLATAGSDESARIWNFLPQRKSAKKLIRKPTKEVWTGKKKSVSNYQEMESQGAFWCSLR